MAFAGTIPLLGRCGEQVPSPRQALKLMRTALGKLQARSGDEIGNDPGHEDLAGVAMRHDASGGVHCDAANIAASQLDFAGMETSAQGQSDLLGGRP